MGCCCPHPTPSPTSTSNTFTNVYAASFHPHQNSTPPPSTHIKILRRLPSPTSPPPSKEVYTTVMCGNDAPHVISVILEPASGRIRGCDHPVVFVQDLRFPSSTAHARLRARPGVRVVTAALQGRPCAFLLRFSFITIASSPSPPNPPKREFQAAPSLSPVLRTSRFSALP